jgi:acyl-CoA reductase-like NAD-dependent aldehyde dehydrogenase
VTSAGAARRAAPVRTVWINDHIPLVSRCRTGGYKVGLRQGSLTYSLEDYTQIKHVMAKLD